MPREVTPHSLEPDGHYPLPSCYSGTNYRLQACCKRKKSHSCQVYKWWPSSPHHLAWVWEHKLHTWPRLLDNLTLAGFRPLILEAARQTRNAQAFHVRQIARREGSGMFVVSYSLLTGTSSLPKPRVLGVMAALAINKQTNDEAGFWVRGTVFLWTLYRFF